MEPKFSELKVLFDLGLTLKQARVYLTLSQSRILKISEISRIANVARPDLYKTLSKLQQLGLVERIIQTPIAYSAIPIEEGVSLLLENKREKFRRIRAETQILLEKAKMNKPNNSNILRDQQFILYPDKIAIKRLDNAIQNAKHSIDFCLSWKIFTLLIAKKFSGILKKLSKENVQNRFLIESPMESEAAKQLIKYYEKKAFCQIKLASKFSKTNFVILDNIKFFMMINMQKDPKTISALWSNNPSLVTLSQKYFDMMWQTKHAV